MKKILFAFLCCLTAFSLFAQTVSMLSAARAELEKRGLTEAEVRTRLLENGIDVDAISPTEYPAYQARVISILNQMEAEKAKKAALDTLNGVAVVPVMPDVVEIEPVVAKDTPQTTLAEAMAEQKLENTPVATDGDDIYGHALFTRKALDVFRTTDGAQAPDTYVLGEGDEVHISIFGSSQTEIHQRIGADGSIHPAGATKIFLKGMTLAQGRKAVQTKLAQHYSFRPDQIAVTITTARTVTVSIYGEVGVQGGFTLSALNTAFNALAAAGGPTAIGTVRDIQLTREGKTHHLDLYAYMTNPASSSTYDLQNGDVLYVPVAKKIVRIAGAVNRPMRYEIKGDESLVDLIELAGGLQYDAYADFVQVERFEDGAKKYLEYDLSSVMDKHLHVKLVNGDVVRIKTFNEPLDKYVAISGAVYYDGNYDLSRNSSLAALIARAKPTVSAREDFVFVERTRPDETVEVLTVPYPGRNGNPDFQLQERDRVRVLELTTYRDLGTISVTGQVRDPFTRDFGLNDHMTINQAIEYAGGLKTTVFPVAYIVRRDVTNPELVEYIRILLDKDGDQLLKPGDELRVYDNTTYTNIGEVRVSGAVKNPVNAAYDKTLTVHNLLEMAGGFSVGAAYDRVEVFRMNISHSDEVKFDKITLTVDEDYNVKGGDFQLQPYDHIVVRLTPNFSTGRAVELNGRVKFPGVYVLDDARTTLTDVVKMAGGFLDDADPFVVLFRSYNGRGDIGLDLRDIDSNAHDSNDPILMDGDVINVVRMENTVTIRETGTRMAQYVTPGTSSTQKTLVYKGKRSAKWYINHYAGGFQKVADRNSVTVTLPNHQSMGTRRFLFFRIYPKVEPGSVIALSTDPEKEQKRLEPKEKVDWDRVLKETLTVITSVSTIILLIERLK